MTFRKRERNGKVTWEGRVFAGYDPATGKRRQISVYAKTKAECQRKAAEVMADLSRQTFLEPSKVTLAEWYQEYLDEFVEGSVKPLTLVKYRSTFRVHIEPALGSLRLQDVNAVHLQRFANSLRRQDLSPKTVKDVMGQLHKALKTAYRIGLIHSNPADLVQLPKASRREIHPFTRDEVARFLREIEGDRCRNALAVTLFCGFRESETLGLSWSQIDMEKRTITVCQQLQRIDGRMQVVPYTKNSKPRTIRMPDITVAYLEAERLSAMKRRLKAGPLWSSSDLVFVDDVGQPMKTQLFYKHFKNAAAAIGRPDATPHTLRHTAATIAIETGSDIKSVQSLLGHATAAFTMDVYAHTSERMMEDTAARMQGYFSGVQ